VTELLACGHERPPFGAPVCAHLSACREPWLSYFKWYTGSALDAELLCDACTKERGKGLPIPLEAVCEECFSYVTTEIGDLAGTRGKAGILIRSEPFHATFKETALPARAGRIVDIAPLEGVGRSVWLLLAEDGRLSRLDADTLEWTAAGSTSVSPESDHKVWNGRVLRRHLHASRCGEFAAVVNDYGRYGEIIDLRSGKVTLALDGGSYHPETVPFSFAFAEVGGRTVAIHRTDWNRLDISAPASGELLSVRGPTSYKQGESRPEHYLDYFHGALYVSPRGSLILDDGWVWHPIGVPTTWSLERWGSLNVWESEDGPTQKALCARNYYWDHAVAWLDETRVALGGIGDDDEDMVDGARIFDTTLPDLSGSRRERVREVNAFPGPAGIFFSDGIWLFSSDATGLSRWDPDGGARTGYLQGFQPTHYHRGAREFVQLMDGTLLRLAFTD
jgi:hypothetical protein